MNECFVSVIFSTNRDERAQETSFSGLYSYNCQTNTWTKLKYESWYIYICQFKWWYMNVINCSIWRESPISVSWFSCRSPIMFEFRDVGIFRGRKTGEPGNKPSKQDKNQQQTKPIEPGLHWWEARAFTKVPSIPALPYSFTYHCFTNSQFDSWSSW